MLLVVRERSTLGRRNPQTHPRSQNAIWGKREGLCLPCSADDCIVNGYCSFADSALANVASIAGHALIFDERLYSRLSCFATQNLLEARSQLVVVASSDSDWRRTRKRA